MKYIYEVARLNAIKAYKLVPENVIEEIQKGNISVLVSVLKEYKYRKIFSLSNPEEEIKDAKVFDSVVVGEIEDTINLVDSLLHKEDRWFTRWAKEYSFSSFLEYKTEEKNLGFVRRKVFDFYYKKFVELKSKLVLDIYRFIIDFENIKLFVVSSLFNTDVNKIGFLYGGKIQLNKFQEFFPSLDKLQKYLEFSEYSGIKIGFDIEPGIYYYENNILKHYLQQAKYYFFSIEPLICYFFEKLLEIRRLRHIYFYATK